MRQKQADVDVASLFAGLAIGASTAVAGMLWYRKFPDNTLSQKRRDWALNRTLRKARTSGRLILSPEHRFVILSDIHKGTRNQADSFTQCEPTYLGALDHYLQAGFTLVVLGDSDELWEEKIPDVLAANQQVYEREANFHPERYIRIGGNHDNLWEDQRLVEHHLHRFYPGLEVRPSLLLQYLDEQRAEASGEILLAHGHQGTLDSDIFDFIPPLILPLYRDFQNLTNFGRTSPARDACLRSIQDNQMYRWARRQAKLILIAGHTHRPIWSSVTHLEKLIAKMYALLELPPENRPGDYDQQVDELMKEIKEREAKYPPCADIIKTVPCYFNTGCCIFEDGDITGIEIENSIIRLIKWSAPQNGLKRVVLEEIPLAEIFIRL
jgi:UDP-2,3-diacylglucosamine pyrophosphatase LpxH